MSLSSPTRDLVLAREIRTTILVPVPPLACFPVKASALRRSAYIELLTSWFDRGYLTWMRKPRWRIVSQACSRSQRDRNLIPTSCRNVKNPWYCFTSVANPKRRQCSCAKQKLFPYGGYVMLRNRLNR